MAMVNSYQDWVELYKKLILELNLENINDHQMIDILESQKQKLIHSLENSLNAIMRTGFTKSR
jgi:plasmid replication initiation protein